MLPTSLFIVCVNFLSEILIFWDQVNSKACMFFLISLSLRKILTQNFLLGLV